jgi:hypothetical protein
MRINYAGHNGSFEITDIRKDTLKELLIILNGAEKSKSMAMQLLDLEEDIEAMDFSKPEKQLPY